MLRNYLRLKQQLSFGGSVITYMYDPVKVRPNGSITFYVFADWVSRGHALLRPWAHGLDGPISTSAWGGTEISPPRTQLLRGDRAW